MQYLSCAESNCFSPESVCSFLDHESDITIISDYIFLIAQKIKD